MKISCRLLQIWLLCAALLPAAAQAGLMFVTNNGALNITGYIGPCGSIVVIPSTTNGYPVTSIVYSAFNRGCLASVIIGNNVTDIGSFAFESCSSLTNVTIGNSVTNIGSYAFEFCTKLTNVTIPSSVTNIGTVAFGGCPSLTVITVNPTNSFYSSTNGVLLNKNQTTLVQYPGGGGGSYTIPQSVTNIGGNAFEFCTSLASVTIPNSVTKIGVGAFYECASLTNVTIGTNVTSIGSQALQDCFNLTSVTIPNSVTSIGSQAFCEDTNLASVTMSTNVTSLGFDVFVGCSSLSSITIPNSVTSLGDGAFQACSSLTGIYFQGNAPGLGSSVFSSDNQATVYYLPWTTGWGTPGTLFGGSPTALWLPQAQTSAASFGVLSNQFGFNITWASGMVVVVDACTNLTNPVWTPVGTNTLTSGSSYFGDSQWTNYPGRFYRLRSP